MALLVVAAIILVKVAVERNRLAQRLKETRRSLFEYGMALDDPNRVIRDYLAGALKHITPDALDKPTIVLALVPHWKNELCIHWVAAEPEADGVEVRLVDRQEALTFALSSYDLEQNRVQARTRVAYTNTLGSPEVEKFLDRIQAAPERPQVVVTLLTHGVPASAPARVFKWEASGSLVSLNESSTTAPTDNRMGSGSFRPK